MPQRPRYLWEVVVLAIDRLQKHRRNGCALKGSTTH